MHYDLIVIGMGLSGLMAAKTAAEMGKKVLIIGKGLGTLSIFSNTIDLLGTIPPTMKMKDGLSQWVHDHPEHPYGKVGLEKIEEALSSFNSFFPPPYTFQSKNDANSLVPTGAGTFRLTYLIPSTMMKGINLKEKKTLIIGFEGYKDFYARRLADLLNCRGITLSLSENPQTEMTAAALARRMEKPSLRDFIGAEVKKEIRDEELIGFPAVLGVNDPMGVRKDIEKKIGASIFEIPGLPPSIPGMRIFNRFKAKLIQKGGNFLSGYSVSKAIPRKNHFEKIEVFHPPVTNSYSADHFILATGRFIGGGLLADRERIVEPLFNLPVSYIGSQEEWFGKSFFAQHSIHGYGILTDASLRPIDENGKPIFENVWVAGTILSGHHCVNEKSREGIEITTGYWTARNAMKL
ncbi:MAG: anaerobic glycerol-3-phosphate dehydrogenase subunit B [Deltaproteobacteria bacterium]|nr:anaerobic glycerol-3-phosphate dehydrogenase subunit B [Deltaproteobacteria bacterium]MBM4347915.1 anaerobic glycerol-3-phosphate dehydrogenase subunit B [Deltaproteobacteria bacterium]